MKKIAVLVGVFILFAVAILPVSAMIGGELDSEHTNVGAIMIEWTQITEDPFVGRLCTATLIHPQTLVTAAHCYQFFVNQDTGYDKIWITFDQDPFAAEAIYLNVEAYIPHPEFNPSSKLHDIALIILEDPVPETLGISPEPVPEEGYLDSFLLGLKGKEKRETRMTIVGYGATALWELPNLHLDALRWVGTVTYQNLLPLEIMTSNSGLNDAAICYGDSGGPIFYVDQAGNEVLAGIHSTSIGSHKCDDDDLNLTLKYRLDTAIALGFINDTIAAYFPPE